MEYCALSESHLPIGVFKFADLAGACAGPKVFSCDIADHLQLEAKKSERLHKFSSLMVVLPNRQLAEGTTACVMPVILSG